MKVIYEAGDYAKVEDNIDAGEFAACDVVLKYKKPNGNWVVSNIDTGNISEVKEIYLRP